MTTPMSDITSIIVLTYRRLPGAFLQARIMYSDLVAAVPGASRPHRFGRSINLSGNVRYGPGRVTFVLSGSYCFIGIKPE